MKKTCISCKKRQPRSEYYASDRMKDGVIGSCKDCVRDRTKKRMKKLLLDPVRLEAERKRNRDKYYRLGYKDKHKPTPSQKRATFERYAEKYPEKMKAGSVSKRIKTKDPSSQTHHWSYNVDHYKDVIELSVSDHFTAHRFIKYDQERMMYRGLDGVLLDTKEAHLKYIKRMIAKDKRQKTKAIIKKRR